jgi:hypothetical protein
MRDGHDCGTKRQDSSDKGGGELHNDVRRESELQSEKVVTTGDLILDWETLSILEE